ncbi:hypothetical protein HU751_016825 [Pseudomonas sp. BW13M1]|uniref:Uncharacterized protein n=1 Tax=Pseudomonas peradeniyensis TaxID=2745488 RepID=A0A923JYD2_9PSED|nr:hypothetical protein [Pseudomonas peradeniyensis]MBV4506513.1 hypothetical protein [Pseudomonas peradeniyensis]
MIDFENMRGSGEFKKHALPYLLGATRRFFGGSVKFDHNPINSIKHQYGIDILENERRGVYIVNSTCAIVLGRVLEGKTVVAAFSLQITNTTFTGLERLLNVFEGVLAITLSHSVKDKFSLKPHQFGDELLELTISKFFSRGRYDYRKFKQLVELFHKLANTKFEGRNFTTGLVLTRSFYAYANKRDHTRGGALLPLKEARKLSPIDPIDKRFWYLADGQTSYFLANPSLEIASAFLANSSRQALISFVDDYTLSKTIKGGDALFRVTSQSEYSITGSEGIEFNFKEGQWRIRSLTQIANLIRSTLNVKEDFIQSLLYYVFYLARRRLSSIIWIPLDAQKFDDLLLSKNSLTTAPFSLLDERHTQTLVRLLSSDGASIFNTDGALLSYGSVIDISKVTINGVKGTGESVASILAKNGLSVKISQDGTIKMFSAKLTNPIVI